MLQRNKSASCVPHPFLSKSAATVRNTPAGSGLGRIHARLERLVARPHWILQHGIFQHWIFQHWILQHWNPWAGTLFPGKGRNRCLALVPVSGDNNKPVGAVLGERQHSENGSSDNVQLNGQNVRRDKKPVGFMNVSPLFQKELL